MAKLAKISIDMYGNTRIDMGSCKLILFLCVHACTIQRESILLLM